MKHQHHDCDHNVRYCKHCDTVYCTVCTKEWTTYPKYTNPWYQPYTYPIAGGVGSTLTSGTLTMSDTTTATCAHA